MCVCVCECICVLNTSLNANQLIIHAYDKHIYVIYDIEVVG